MSAPFPAPPPPFGSPGHLLGLVRDQAGATRAELAHTTGLARSTIAHRVETLLDAGYLIELGEAPSTGGRRPALLDLNADAGIVLVADLGATHSRLAACDLRGVALIEHTDDIDIDLGPHQVLDWATEHVSGFLRELDRESHDVLGIGIGVPGPVDFEAGRAIHPPIMPGWHDYPIRERFENEFGVPTLVDNDVNIMALGEHWVMDLPADDFVFVKVGTGIGAGIMTNGHLHRGHHGAAGDLGHVQVGPASVTCRCGNSGCLEAAAGGAAIAAALRELGIRAAHSRDVVRLVREGNPEAIGLVRQAGRLIGEALTFTVNLLNPAVIMIGGDLADAGRQLLAGIREVVYQRSTALATHDLTLTTATLGDRAGTVGAAALIIEHVLDPSRVNHHLDTLAASA